MNIPSMTCVSTFGFTVACGNSPLSALSTFNEAVLNTGGARLLLFVSVFDATATTSDGLVFDVVVAGDEVVDALVFVVAVPDAEDAIDEMLTVTATDEDVTDAHDADVIDIALDVVTEAVDILPSLIRDCDSVSFGDAFTFVATVFACEALVGVVLIKSATEKKTQF